MKTKLSRSIVLLVALAMVGQVLFAFKSGDYTAPRYEGQLYATTGVKHKSEDLHKLNEAGHYFGQTMIGWTKFPNFLNHLKATVKLPEDVSIGAHIQERQNIIFTLSSGKSISRVQLEGLQEFMQSRIDEYNENTNTEFVLTNFDYLEREVTKGYAFGALVALILSLIVGFAVIFIKREFSR